MGQHTLRLNPRHHLNVLVVGAGGSGSGVYLALPYLHQAMLAWGHYGLNVTLMDADTVSATNCIRQPFALSDVGQNKATVLVNRCNLFWGLDWKAAPVMFSPKINLQGVDILIGCVDSKASRASIHKAVTGKKGYEVRYWLDLGNSASSGQFVLGQPCNKNGFPSSRDRSTHPNRLPTAAELYPEIIDTTGPEDDLPSCSAVEALQRQEPYINQTLALAALAMLTQLFRYGTTSYHGGFYNAKTGTMQPIAVPTPPTPKKRSVKK